MTNALTLPLSAAFTKPLPSHSEDLQAPISGQFRSSPFYVAITSLPLSGLIAIALTWACYATLPKEAADGLAPQLQLFTLGTGALGSSGGVLGMVKRGLDITNGKINSQLPQVPATVNAGGEGAIGQTATQSPAGSDGNIGTNGVQVSFVDANNNGIDDNDEGGPQDDEAI